MAKKVVRRKIEGRYRDFKQIDTNEFDEIGLKKKDFVERKTLAIPQPEGWFHIKKPAKAYASSSKIKQSMKKIGGYDIYFKCEKLAGGKMLSAFRGKPKKTRSNFIAEYGMLGPSTTCKMAEKKLAKHLEKRAIKKGYL